MKMVIWILCVFAAALIMTLFRAAGIVLGAIPTAIIGGGAIYLANVLCKMWDEKHPK